MSATILNLEPGVLKPGAAVRILPAGTFRAHDGRPENLLGWRMDATIAAAVIARKPPGTTEFMIDYEHQSLNSSTNGKPAPAAGWFKRLEWREGDGLYMADITWTKSARAMIAAMEYRHLSPVFGFNSLTGAVTHIISVSLTNTPALNGLADLAAARAMLTSQGGSEVSMTPDERHNFERCFGFDPMPGHPKPESIASASTMNLGTAMAGMAVEDRAKYERAFGHVFAAIGQPMPKL